MDMSNLASRGRRSVIPALRFALFSTCGAILVGPVMSYLKSLSHPHGSLNLVRVIEFTLVTGVIGFVGFFLYCFLVLTRNVPAADILAGEFLESDRLAVPALHFVAIEYYWLIWNRTFVVFITPDGLYGWKASGAVTNAKRDYYEPLVELASEPELAQDLGAIRKLSKLNGGFLIARSDIASVESSYKLKWGMGGIPHSGRITVTTNTGHSREFIVLGNSFDPDSLRDGILSQS
jgi:hypothetical protein